MAADPRVGEGEARGPKETRSVWKADGSGVNMFQKGPTIPAEHKGDSAIPESSATWNNYFVDRPILKSDG